MIIDTSAIIAILKSEPESSAIAQVIGDSPEQRVMSAANYLEAGIVADSPKSRAVADHLDETIEDFGIEIAPVTAEHARIARQAYRTFGKGSGHAAQLNFGDCFAYALAMETGQPLLFKGDDFAQTDVVIARY